MKKNCLNCDQTLVDEAIYCNNCGQSTKESTLSFKQIVTEALSNIFNLDSRLLHTLKDIHRPSKLTQVYVEGRRKFYVNPIRLFLFFIIVLISLILLLADIASSDKMSNDIVEDAHLFEIADQFDSLALQYGSIDDKTFRDTIRYKLFSDLDKDNFNYLGKNITINNTKFSDYGITKTDAVNMTDDEIFEKYKIEGFQNRLIVRQFLKFVNDTSGGIKYAVKNFTWVILLLMFFSALALKIMHIRRNYFLVEHLILMLYSHVFLFVLMILTLLAEMLGLDIEIALLIVLITYVISLYLTFHKYYRQSHFWTLAKFFLFLIVYIFLFLIIALFVSLFSLAIY